MRASGPCEQADTGRLDGRRRASCRRGTVGGWCAYFLQRSGAGRVVLLERSTLGQGASSRAAGIVRSQGGTPTAVRLAEWSRDLLPGPAARSWAIDSGFVARATSSPPSPRTMLPRPRRRWPCSRVSGLDVAGCDADEADPLNPTLRPGSPRAVPFSTTTATSTRPATCWPTRWRWPRPGCEVYEGRDFAGLVLAGGPQ